MTEFARQVGDPADLDHGIEVRAAAGHPVPVLAVVQFTNISDFMIVMALGPSVRCGPLIWPETIRADRLFVHTQRPGLPGCCPPPSSISFGRKCELQATLSGLLVRDPVCCGGLPKDIQGGGGPALPARVLTGAFRRGVLGGLSVAIIGDVFPEHRRDRPRVVA